MSLRTFQHTPVARGRSRFCLRVQLSGTGVRPYGWEIFDDEDAKVIRRSMKTFRTSADAWAAGIHGPGSSVITDDDIRRVVPQRSFAAGGRYHLDRRVQEVRMAADGTTINALVLGSGHSIYEQSIPMRVLKGRKQALADGIRGAGNRTTLALTKADLEMLFG